MGTTSKDWESPREQSIEAQDRSRQARDISLPQQ